ncbi:MAG: PoNe immunity protein domain-containing protein [Candidatus Thiodiazotropha endolucinida]
MIRDTFKEKAVFDRFCESAASYIPSAIKKLDNKEIREERIGAVEYDIIRTAAQLITAHYSSGSRIEELSLEIRRVVGYIERYWKPEQTKVTAKVGKKFELWDQYMVGPYEYFLHILSLAYLLNVPDKEFQVLINIIDRDNISDNLYEFIIKARFPQRDQNRAEEYSQDKSIILKVYKNLRAATQKQDKAEAAKLVKRYLEKDFYHKHANFYNAHNSRHEIYYGYWSFESAAVTAIMGLDDSSFRENQYYPKDLSN